MVQMDLVTSLKVVKAELDSNFTKAAAALEQFALNVQAVHHLGECRDLLTQAANVLRLLSLEAARDLLMHIMRLLDQLQAQNLDGQDLEFTEKMACLGLSLIQLQHFLEYSLLRERYMPELLADSINTTRRLLGEPPYGDGHYTNQDYARPELKDIYAIFDEALEPMVADGQRGNACRPFRLMFQVGLLGLLQSKQISGAHYGLMARSLQRLNQTSADAPVSRLWLVGRGALMAMRFGKVELTPSRIFLLSRIERQIKQIVYGPASLLESEPSEALIRDCVAIIGAAEVGFEQTEQSDDDELMSRLDQLDRLAQLFTAKAEYPDTYMRAELRLMNGPTGNVIQSVVQLIYEELSPLKDAMDLRARDVEPNWNQERSPRDMVEQLAHTLTIIGELESAALLHEQLPVIDRLIDPESMVTHEQLQILADTFVYTEQALAQLLGRYAVNLEDDDETQLAPRTVLEQARRLVFTESRASLGVVKRAIASYVDSHGDQSFVDQVAPHLDTSIGALQFLHLNRAASVLDRSSRFIQSKLRVESEQMPSRESMETLADVLTSVDYYLESLEDNKAIGDGVLDAAELSVRVLDQPVSA